MDRANQDLIRRLPPIMVSRKSRLKFCYCPDAQIRENDEWRGFNIGAV